MCRGTVSGPANRQIVDDDTDELALERQPEIAALENCYSREDYAYVPPKL